MDNAALKEAISKETLEIVMKRRTKFIYVYSAITLIISLICLIAVPYDTDSSMFDMLTGSSSREYIMFLKIFYVFSWIATIALAVVMIKTYVERNTDKKWFKTVLMFTVVKYFCFCMLFMSHTLVTIEFFLLWWLLPCIATFAFGAIIVFFMIHNKYDAKKRNLVV